MKPLEAASIADLASGACRTAQEPRRGLEPIPLAPGSRGPQRRLPELWRDAKASHPRHGAEHIGKEANRWEEQLHLGLDLEAQTAYGLSPGGRERALEAARRTGNTYGHRQLAAAAGISLSELSAVLLGKRSPSSCTFAKLCVAASCLLRGESEEAEQCRNVLEEVGRLCKLQGLRRLARRAEIDSANLNRVVKGRTKPSQLMLVKLHVLLAE
jgi:transcriptional regulator with XRE-family HTH domain